MASASGSHKESDMDVKARRGKTIFTTLVFDKMAQCALLFAHVCSPCIHKDILYWIFVTFLCLAFVLCIFKQILQFQIIFVMS